MAGTIKASRVRIPDATESSGSYALENDNAGSLLVKGGVPGSEVTLGKVGWLTDSSLASLIGQTAIDVAVPPWANEVSISVYGALANTGTVPSLGASTAGGAMANGFTGCVSQIGGSVASTASSNANLAPLTYNWATTNTFSGTITARKLASGVWEITSLGSFGANTCLSQGIWSGLPSDLTKLTFRHSTATAWTAGSYKVRIKS